MNATNLIPPSFDPTTLPSISTIISDLNSSVPIHSVTSPPSLSLPLLPPPPPPPPPLSTSNSTITDMPSVSSFSHGPNMRPINMGVTPPSSMSGNVHPSRFLHPTHRYPPSHSHPIPPAPGAVTLDDYMIAMEARFLYSQDRYFDKAMRDVNKTIRDLQDDLDNDLNLTLQDERASIHENIYRAKTFLDYLLERAAHDLHDEISASEAQFQTEADSLKTKMLAEVTIRRKKLDDERTQDVFSLNLDSNESSTRTSRYNPRKQNKRGGNDDQTTTQGRKKTYKLGQGMVFKLTDDAIQEDLVNLNCIGQTTPTTSSNTSTTTPATVHVVVTKSRTVQNSRRK